MTNKTNKTSIQTIAANYIEAAGTADDALATRRETAIEMWQAFNKQGADTLAYFNKPTKEERANNVHVNAYNTIYDAMGNVLVGPKIMQDVIYNKAISGEGAVKLAGNVMTGTRTKKYIQQQIGKKISLWRSDVKLHLASLDGDKDSDGAAARNTDMDRVYNALAKVVTQIRKANGDDSISEELRAKLKDMDVKAMWKAICNA